MRHRQLGCSGLRVSVVGLGCNNFRSRMSDEAGVATVSAALDAGVTLFDTADVYGAGGGSEELLGQALQGRRDEAVVATKFGLAMPGRDPDEPRGSRRYIRDAVDASLRRLQTDRIDLYQLHEPDPRTPLEETLAALGELVREGKVLYIGSSNFAGWQVSDAEWTARTRGTERFISAQNHYNLLRREVEAELVPSCAHHGVGILPFFPLENGVLTGKYRRGAPADEGTRLGAPRLQARRAQLLTEATFDTIERLEAFGRVRGHGMVEVAIAGLAAQTAVASVIAGATSPEQVRANAAAGDWELDAGDRAALRACLGSPVAA